MAVKAGSIIHVGNDTVLVDRIQSGGPGQVNIPTEKIYELGNYQSVATIRDTPDLTFQLESYDVSTEIETMLAGAAAFRSVSDGVVTAADATVTSASAAFTSADVGAQIVIPGAGTAGATFYSTIITINSGTSIEMAANAVTSVGSNAVLNISPVLNLATVVPLDVASQFKAGQTATSPFAVVGSVCLPFLYPESIGYRFGYRDNAAQTASLRGDSIFWNPGSTYVEATAGTNTPAQAIATAQPAYQYNGDGNPRRALSVTVNGRRLTKDVDYTESYGAITTGACITTVTVAAAVPTTQTVRIAYASPTAKSYLQNVHPATNVKPAAVRGKDIDVYIGGYTPGADNSATKWTSVQAVTVDWSIQLDKDEEFGNYYAVSQDYDVPTVTGSIDIKPRDVTDILAKIKQVSGASTTTEVYGAQSSTPLTLDIVIKDAANSNATLKRIHVPDARFTVPGFQGQVQQKLTATLNFESDGGLLRVYKY